MPEKDWQLSGSDAFDIAYEGVGYDDGPSSEALEEVGLVAQRKLMEVVWPHIEALIAEATNHEGGAYQDAREAIDALKRIREEVQDA